MNKALSPVGYRFGSACLRAEPALDRFAGAIRFRRHAWKGGGGDRPLGPAAPIAKGFGPELPALKEKL